MDVNEQALLDWTAEKDKPQQKANIQTLRDLGFKPGQTFMINDKWCGPQRGLITYLKVNDSIDVVIDLHDTLMCDATAYNGRDIVLNVSTNTLESLLDQLMQKGV